LRILRWEGYPGLLGRPNVIPRVFLTERGGQESQRDEIREAEVRWSSCQGNMGSLYKIEKAKKHCLLHSPKGREPY
jgi:hypothetical protein